MAWTAEQVLALAPDAASARAGQGLDSPGKWEITGLDADAAWGLAKGSAATPYQAAVAFAGPAFKCSCPSRKIPCKHVIGLMLMISRGAVPAGEKPEWVREWIQKREAKAASPPKEKATAAPRPEDQVKRAEQRASRVNRGIEECELWLKDLIRMGLAAPELQSAAYWKRIQGRMVDAQAPGLARRIKEIESVVGSRGWQERALERLGSLHLLLKAFARLETLPDGLQNDVRSAIGWTLKKEDLPTETAVVDNWTVVAQHEFEEDRLKVRRSWLWGLGSQRWAAVLAFSAAGQPFDVNLVPGSAFRGEIRFYPSAFPQRAIVFRQNPGSVATPPAKAARDLQTDFARGLGANPWLEACPWMVEGRLGTVKDAWQIVTRPGERVPVRFTGNAGWSALAISAGEKMALCGEWNGSELLPLAMWQGDRFIHL